MHLKQSEYDNLPCEILIHYKSNQRHIHQTSVKDARSRSKTAIRRKSVHYIRVLIPNPDGTRAIMAVYEHGQWLRKIVDLPPTKD